MWIDAKKILPKTDGHYLVIWPNSTSRDYPNICSEYHVLCFLLGVWCAPVSVEFPVTHWMELPERPNE